MCSRQKFNIYHLRNHYFTIIHYFCRVKVFFSLFLLQGCQQSDLLPTGHLQICRYGDCKTPADQAKYSPGLPGTVSPWSDMYELVCSDYRYSLLVSQYRPNLASQSKERTCWAWGIAVKAFRRDCRQASKDRRKIDYAGQSTERAFRFRLMPEFAC